MRALLFGAVLGLVLAVSGVPLAPAAAVLAAVAQPVVLAFAAGLLARPYLARSRGWTA